MFKECVKVNKINLNGTWTLSNLTNSTYLNNISVTVPGSVISSALENHFIDHPYYENNEADIQYLFDNDYSFCRTFTLDADVAHSTNVLLTCYGLDTLATIFINNIEVAVTDNMFRSFHINIKPYISIGQNTIEIQFSSPTQYLKKLKNQGKNGLAYLRKAQCMFGWDWGIKLPDSGIWKSIAI